MSDQTILITGAAHRIGRGLALALAAKGAKIGVHYNNSQTAALTVVDEITTNGGRAVALGADLADMAAVDRLIPDCAVQLGTVTCLINNASTFHEDTATSMTAELWASHLDINLRAPVFLAKSFAAHLPPGHQGSIINIIDQRVWNLKPDFFSYTIAKAGLWTATQTMAQALAPDIRVNAIGPGPVIKSIHQTEAEFAIEQTSTPLNRGATPKDIAKAVSFILDAPAMTGQMIALDGGQHLG